MPTRLTVPFILALSLTGCSENEVKGIDSPSGSDGQDCWDADGNGEADLAEDINGDGVVDVEDCQGNGLDCWDLNGNGLPDPEEDTNNDGAVDVWDCRDDGAGDTGDTGSGSGDTGGVYLGGLTLHNETEAAYFCDHYDTVYGSLSISGDYDATDLSALSCIVGVSQAFYIAGDELTNVELDNLEYVGTTLDVTGGSIARLSFASLATVEFLELENVAYDLSEAEASFPALTSTHSSLFIQNTGFETLYFPSLTTVGGRFEITGNDNLIAMDGFDSLEQIEDSLVIQVNLALEDVTGLMGVQWVGSNLEVTDNPTLPTSQANTLGVTIPYIGGGVYISGNGDG